jgi:tRNA uridine 5-carbamoylmethylation protein Kti12
MQTMAPPENALTERLARLDERIVAVDKRITETAKGTNRRITEGREETNHRFDRVEGDIRELKKSVIAIHATLTRISVGVGLTFASVLLTKVF